MNTRLLTLVLMVVASVASNAQLFRMGATRNLTSVSNITANGYLSLSGATNRLTVADGSLKLDGTAVGGNSGDPFVITSELADNATNVALVVNTEENWADWTGSAFLVLQRNGTNIFKFQTEGILDIRNDGAQVLARDLSGQNQANLSAQPGYVYLALSSTDLTTRTYLAPDEGASTTPYGLDTSLAHTSGNLLDIKNNGTNKLSVAFDGAQTVAQVASEPSAPAAGYYTLFAIDNGGGKMVLKVRFPTGVSQTVATEP